jgi:hypothetical protein
VVRYLFYQSQGLCVIFIGADLACHVWGQPKSTLSESANAVIMIFLYGQNTAANMITDQCQILIIQVKIPENAVFL